MSEMFRCTVCKEVIRIEAPVCQYCNSPVDGPAARIEAVKFKAGVDACAAANHLKSLNYGLPIFILLQIDRLFLNWSGALLSPPNHMAFMSVLPLGPLAGGIRWHTRYAGLQTDDPDFPEAKKAVNKSLAMWLIVATIQIAVLVMFFLARH